MLPAPREEGRWDLGGGAPAPGCCSMFRLWVSWVVVAKTPSINCRSMSSCTRRSCLAMAPAAQDTVHRAPLLTGGDEIEGAVEALLQPRHGAVHRGVALRLLELRQDATHSGCELLDLTALLVVPANRLHCRPDRKNYLHNLLRGANWVRHESLPPYDEPGKVRSRNLHCSHLIQHHNLLK